MTREVADMLTDFVKRPPENRSLKVMRYEERDTPFGVRYVRSENVHPQ